MIHKKIEPLDANDYFSNASQVALAIIEKNLTQHGYTSFNMNDLIKFSCIFLRIILFRIDIKIRERVNHHLPEILKTAALDGVAMYSIIVSSKIDTVEDGDKTLQSLISSFRGNGMADRRLFQEVAEYTNSIGMVNDGLWKLEETIQFSAALEKEVESQLNELIDEKINSVVQMGVKIEGDSPEINFFVNASINTGLMIGYASVIYHQSLDEMIDSAIKQIRGTISNKDYQIANKVN